MGILILIFFIVFIVLLYQKRVLAHNTQLMNREQEHQRKLLDASVEIAEQERFRIAANMHDDVGMLLNVLKLNLARARRDQHSNRDAFEKVMDNSLGIIDNSIMTIRSIANDLMPSVLINLGLVKSIRELCNQINLSGTVVLKLVAEVEDVAIDRRIELQVYRLIKELLNNTIKHAAPSFITIHIDLSGSNLSVEMTHDGKGVTTAEIREMASVSTGLGLKSILTRTQFINARLEFLILNKNTAQVIIDVPISH